MSQFIVNPLNVGGNNVFLEATVATNDATKLARLVALFANKSTRRVVLTSSAAPVTGVLDDGTTITFVDYNLSIGIIPPGKGTNPYDAFDITYNAGEEHFNISSFVIDRAVRGTMFRKGTYELLWSLNQITDPSISMTSDSTDAVDAIGVPIMSFERAKTCEFSGSNALFDLGLLAAQSGTQKKVASALETITVSTCETIDWVTGTGTVLNHIPVGTAGAEVPFIYGLNPDGTIGAKYVVGASAGAGVFSVNAQTKTVTPPTDVTTPSKALVFYDYVADGTDGLGAVQATADAINFPDAGRFLLEVLGHDTCDITTKYYAYVDFPAAKLSSEFDLDLTTDGQHPFTLRCMQDYCDYEKKLFTVTIPEQ